MFDYGTRGDGRGNDTAAVQRTMDAASGGGSIESSIFKYGRLVPIHVHVLCALYNRRERWRAANTRASHIAHSDARTPPPLCLRVGLTSG